MTLIGLNSSRLPYDSIQERNAKKQKDASTAYGVQNGAIPVFLNKLKEWKFNFPSSNLWTIEIKLHNDGTEANHSLLTLYTNIDKANRIYENTNGTHWKVSNSSNYNFANDYLNRFQTDKTALFLAQGISFGTRTINISDNTADFDADKAGFIKYGTIENGASYNPTCRIQFLETNWSLSDILFDKWIAAIGQQGLIEDSSLPNIKADIYLYQYSASISAQMINNKSTSRTDWQLRKITKLLKAFPTNRSGTTDINYDNNGPKTETVEFSFMDYQVEYVV